MIVTSITELPTPASTPALNGTAQLSAQAPQSFSDSLIAASKASSESGISQDLSPKGGRQQKSNSDDARQPGALADHRSAQTKDVDQQPAAPQQATPDMQAQLTSPIVTPLQQSFELPRDISNLLGASTTATGRGLETGLAPGSEASAETSVAQPANFQTTNTPADSSTMQTASSFSGFAVQANSASTGIFSRSWNEVSTTVAPATASSIQQPAQSTSTLATPHGLLFSIPASNLQDASGTTQAVASTDLTRATKGTALAATAADAPSSFSDRASTESSNATTAAGVSQDSVPSAPQAVPLNPVQSVDLNQAPTSPVSDHAVQDMRSALNAAAKEAVAAAVSAAPAVQTAAPHSAASTPSTVASYTDASHISASTQPSGQLNLTQTVKPSLSATPVSKPFLAAASDSKAGPKGSANDAAGSKQHSLSTQDQAGTDTNSQTTSSDQTQSNSTSQVPSTAPAEMNITNHTAGATAHAQDMVSNVPAAVGTSTAHEAGFAAKTPEATGTASVAAAATLTPPAINTAKLIQNVAQSEMRVGMRSNEFGNISINTSATKELVSAQISVDHGELAKVLATHLPEMQTRLGGNQAVDVRIDMSGQGQGTGTSSGMSQSSSDHSRENRSQGSSAASAFSRAGLAESTSSISSSVVAAGGGGLNSRLDVTV